MKNGVPLEGNTTMYDKLNGIVLNTVKYSDRTSIVHVYTDGRGLMSFAVPQGHTRGARMRNAMLMPLSLVEFQASIVPGKELCTMRDLRRTVPLVSVYCDPVKNAIALFMSEVLSHVIVEHERNTALYNYIYHSVQVLEAATAGVANMHICFLFHLGALLGIEPDLGSYHDGYWFNMAEGTFSGTGGGLRSLPPDQARVIVLLSRMRYDNMHLFRFNREQRGEVLDIILDYFKMHNSTLGSLRSPAILKQLFT